MVDGLLPGGGNVDCEDEAYGVEIVEDELGGHQRGLEDPAC